MRAARDSACDATQPHITAAERQQRHVGRNGIIDVVHEKAAPRRYGFTLLSRSSTASSRFIAFISVFVVGVFATVRRAREIWRLGFFGRRASGLCQSQGMNWPAPEPLTAARLMLEPLSIMHATSMVDVLAESSLYDFTGGEKPSLKQLENRYAAQVVGHSENGSQ